MFRKCPALCLALALCVLNTIPSAAGEAVDVGAVAVTAPSMGIPVGEEIIMTGTVVGDAFYSISETSLGLKLNRTAIDGEQTETLSRDSVLDTLNGLFEYKGGLYGICVGDNSWLRLLDEQGAFAPERQAAELDLTGLKDGGGEPMQPDTLFVQDDYLYYTANEQFSANTVGGRVSLLDGHRQEFDIDNLRYMAPYEHSKVIVYQREPQAAGAENMGSLGQCAVFDADTNAMDAVLSIPADGTPDTASLNGFCYGDGSIFYTSGAHIMGLNISTGESRISAYTGEENAGSGSASAFYIDGSYLTYSYSGMMLYPLDSPSLLEGALRVSGESGSSAHMSFLKNHPGIPIDIVRYSTNSIEDITQAMLTEVDPYDVLLLNLTYMPVESLLRKGYAADLSGDAELLGVLGRMYPEYANAMQKDGRLYGVPVNVRINTMGVNMELWESLGLTADELPASFPQLLDFAANWAYDYADEHSDISLFDMEHSSSLMFTHMLNTYIAYMQSKGEDLRFDTPELRTLLNEFSKVDFSEIDGLRNQEYVFSAENTSLFSFSNNITPVGYGRTAQAPLYLAIADGEAPVIAANLTVMIINPKTPRMDTALMYMKNYISNLPATGANIMLYPEHNDAVEMPGYRQAMNDAEATLENAQRRLEAAGAEYKAEIQESIHSVEYDIEYLEQNRFDVTAEDIDRYRNEVQPKVYVQQQNPLTSGDKQSQTEINSIINRYLGGAVSTDMMIQELDNRLRLMSLEGQ